MVPPGRFAETGDRRNATAFREKAWGFGAEAAMTRQRGRRLKTRESFSLRQRELERALVPLRGIARGMLDALREFRKINLRNYARTDYEG